RIFNELCGEQGSCTTVSGARIFVPRFAYEPDRTSGRSDSERIIMAACMELANGESHSYCNHCDSNYDNDTGHMYSGLYDRDIKRLIEALTGETVTVRSTSEHSSQALADSLKKDLAEGKQVFLSMRWRHGSSSSKSHLRHLLPDQELGEDEGHTHAVGPAAPSTNAWSYHQVMALEVKNYRAWGQTLQGQMIQFDEPWLHYRNLHRLTQYQPGSELQNPRRRIINREGVEAMPLYQIQDRISRTYSFSPR
ncbi:MAG: hypothetical protein KDD62_03825, partial [Bdellovibrionales bacterium]|nr:hypothetical protein [Bdellovibrionales bacterium]